MGLNENRKFAGNPPRAKVRCFRPTTCNGRLELSSFCVDGLDDSKRWVVLDEHSDKQPMPARAEISATAIDQAGLRQDPDGDRESHVNIVDWPSEEERQRTCQKMRIRQGERRREVDKKG